MTTTLSRLHALPDPVADAPFYAGVPTKRLLAWVVDVTLVAIVCILMLPFTAFTGVFYFPFLMMCVGFPYRWATIAGRSATWGMRLMGIELRDHDGQRLSGTTAFLHTAGYTVSLITAPLQILSVVLMAVAPRGQGLSDYVLGTTAINRPA
ncbi:Uncharacterized membrane protein YckC, RDD family [Loktanella fryxellensis]|uniref:Uncharacterized membrane protein YckC, RDD family n=1 Tax=Loktanella fryxellensis TaxID=245187 RepID=A0A1H7YAT4_9RHOB|nr:RDD family protein [Loktanella fryxellensis]SEM43302.1 Uncharacterized membrane protein YckC, RDD family [Loktanella fryxellensis]